MRCLIVILLSVFLLSCTEKVSERVVLDIVVDMAVRDAGGVDLLNPNNANAFNKDLIKLIFEVDGKQNEYYDENLDYRKGFFIYQHENTHRIRVFPNSDHKESFPITYIQWNETDTDTLKCEIDRVGSSKICRKVWFNGELVWDNKGDDRFFEITK